ncbi:MAG: sulfide-dependent adenosine diphosphate thiazole synthase [Candidatus Bathyarchaeia archaeon]
MGIDESVITKAIVKAATDKLYKLADVDVIVVGAGPAGLTAATYLAKNRLNTLLVERRLSFGGGIGGGGMQLPAAVVEKPADDILREVKCRLKQFNEELYLVDPAEMAAKLAAAAVDAGAEILLGVSVDDVIFRIEDNTPKIVGVVVQWSSIVLANLHVDPISFKAKAVVDCTGHEAEVLSIVFKKVPGLNKSLPGEASMWAAEGEKLVVEKTGKVCDGLYVAGMAVAALYRLPRMGPIFGGMLLSGRRVAEIVSRDILGKWHV